MKRRKDLEYGWILSGALFVHAYTAKLENGKTLVVYAHDFNDMKFFLSKIQVYESFVEVQMTDSDLSPKRQALSYIPNRKGDPKSKPFWYRGRVYEVEP